MLAVHQIWYAKVQYLFLNASLFAVLIDASTPYGSSRVPHLCDVWNYHQLKIPSHISPDCIALYDSTS